MNGEEIELKMIVKRKGYKSVGIVIEAPMIDGEMHGHVVWQNGKHSLIPATELGKVIETSRTYREGKRRQEPYTIIVDYGNGLEGEEGTIQSLDYLDKAEKRYFE